MTLFLALCFVGIAIGGACAFVIFWPLSLVHLRERDPQLRARLGDGAFLKLSALRWLLAGGYRESRDRQFTGLATPARIALMTVLAGVGMAALLWLWSLA
ncbi:hypothetical protein [Luteimonas sp. R10]|uniref:hypothetical protein n=1 Tax=Luteimonas sp. R10 TaxID=3108176 RepID=UPI00308666B0|nr:hypothetical protein U3649_12700 [Luteimonas sp. R10]